MGSEKLYKTYRLGEVGEIVTGKTPSTKIKENFGDFIPFVTPGDLQNGKYVRRTERYLSKRGLSELKNKFLPAGAIMVSCIGTVGEIAIAGKGCVTNQQINSIIPHDNFSGDYIYYNLKQRREELINYASGGSVVPIINKTNFSNLLINVPEQNEQEKIANILSSFDDKIELNQRMNETLEAIARAVFKSWFVDFDPVRAKMAGEAYPLPAEVMALFPDELVESELGLIPKGWEVSTINDELELVGGGTPSTKNPKYWENGIYNFATPKDLSNLSSIFLLDTDRKVTEGGLNKISSGLLKPGTLLMSSRAPVGYLAINQVPVCINQGFIAMKCNKKLSTNYMLNWAVANMEKIKSRASGTTFSELSKRNFRPMEIFVPSQEVIFAFEKHISSIFNQIILILKMNNTLKSQRESLLHYLL